MKIFLISSHLFSKPTNQPELFYSLVLVKNKGNLLESFQIFSDKTLRIKTGSKKQAECDEERWMFLDSPEDLLGNVLNSKWDFILSHVWLNFTIRQNKIVNKFYGLCLLEFYWTPETLCQYHFLSYKSILEKILLHICWPMYLLLLQIPPRVRDERDGVGATSCHWSVLQQNQSSVKSHTHI